MFPLKLFTVKVRWTYDAYRLAFVKRRKKTFVVLKECVCVRVNSEIF